MTDLSKIAQALNQVQTAGQARAAIGQALVALSNAYDVNALYVPSSLRASYTKSLDAARLNLEAWYNSIAATGTDDYTATWAAKRDLVTRAYVEIAGVEGAASYVPSTSNADILLESIQEAPGLFLSTVGEAAGAIAKAAGNAAGQAAGGVASGLGIEGIAMVAVGLAVFFIVVKKTNPLAGLL